MAKTVATGFWPSTCQKTGNIFAQRAPVAIFAALFVGAKSLRLAGG
jgi:hypothetical protein